MYYYAPDNNRRGKCAGAIAVGCYLLIFAAVALLVSFRTDYEPASEGIKSCRQSPRSRLRKNPYNKNTLVPF